jgi:hypothetical protein
MFVPPIINEALLYQVLICQGADLIWSAQKFAPDIKSLTGNAGLVFRRMMSISQVLLGVHITFLAQSH